jgi:hypothetical protein
LTEKQTQNKLDFERKKCQSKREKQDSGVRIQEKNEQITGVGG